MEPTFLIKIGQWNSQLDYCQKIPIDFVFFCHYFPVQGVQFTYAVQNTHCINIVLTFGLSTKYVTLFGHFLSQPVTFPVADFKWQI